jgi:4-nitrophenyl phosphatase
MVGDRLDTDIMFGKMGGLSTLLVMTGEITASNLTTKTNFPLTGVTTDKDITGPDRSLITPDYIAESIGDLCKINDSNS